MGMNIGDSVRESILRHSQAVWCEKNKYLGITILNTDKPKEWLDSNLHPMINHMSNQLRMGEIKIVLVGQYCNIETKDTF